MFAPTRTWRRWHRTVNINPTRYAVASAIAASAVPALVLERGHHISAIPEIPLVVSSEIVESLTKTKNALALLTKLKADADVDRCKKVSKHSGTARLRNRAKKIKVGPLIITGTKGAAAFRAFRNLAGVQVTGVWDLNLLKLAPGGHLGRFIIWTRSAFEQLETIFGTANKASAIKSNYFLPRPILANPDIRRVIQSDSVQAVVSAKPTRFAKSKKPNYVKNHKALARLNPYAAHQRANQQNREASIKASKKNPVVKKAAPKKAAPKKQGGKEAAQRTQKRYLYAKYRKLVFSK